MIVEKKVFSTLSLSDLGNYFKAWKAPLHKSISQWTCFLYDMCFESPLYTPY